MVQAEIAESIESPVVPERRTTPVELLWDLVFVFAVTRVTTLLSGDLSWAGWGRSMLVLALVWWAWSAFVWATNAQDPDAAVFRGVLLLAMVLIFIDGLALPNAFGSEGTLFAVAYTGVRLLHLGLYVDASRRGNASLAAIAGFGVTVLVGMALLIVGSRLTGPARTWLWLPPALLGYPRPALAVGRGRPPRALRRRGGLSRRPPGVRPAAGRRAQRRQGAGRRGLP